MIVSGAEVLYRRGKDTNLDKEYSRYKRMRLWSVYGPDEALTEKEAESLLKLWKKERLTPRKLTVQDVKTLVDFASHVRSHRGRVKKEQARRRKERQRAKLRKAARNGDDEAKRKICNIKISDKKRFSKRV